MMTPNDVRLGKEAIDTRAKSELATTTVPGAIYRVTATFYRDVLREIAHGSIDPKSLARAALEPEEKF